MVEEGREFLPGGGEKKKHISCERQVELRWTCLTLSPFPKGVLRGGRGEFLRGRGEGFLRKKVGWKGEGGEEDFLFYPAKGRGGEGKQTVPLMIREKGREENTGPEGGKKKKRIVVLVLVVQLKKKKKKRKRRVAMLDSKKGGKDKLVSLRFGGEEDPSNKRGKTLLSFRGKGGGAVLEKRKGEDRM